MWGVYEEIGEVHVIPCNEQGVIKEPHIVDEVCFCVPEIAGFRDDGTPVFNHKDFQ